MMTRLGLILTLLLMAGCGGGTGILPEPFTRERADGKIPVKTELIRAQVRAELAGMPEGEAEVARWQAIETDYHACRLIADKAKADEEKVFADCMAQRGYVYMYPIDAEQFHNDIEFEITKEHDRRIAAERKAEEERIAAERKAEEERIAAEKKRQEEQEQARRQKALNDALIAAVRNGDSAEEARLIAEGANPQVAERQHKLIASERKAKEERIAAARKAEEERIAVEKKRQEEQERISRQEYLDNILFFHLSSPDDLSLIHIHYALNRGANVNAKNNDGRTPLHTSMWNSHIRIVSVLIDEGADIDAKDNDGFTPLHIATQEGYTEKMHLLIRAEASINEKQKGGATPLHFATKNDKAKAALILIKAKADIEAKDNMGRTPLHYAAYNGQAKTSHILIKAGANVFARTNDGITPLDFAIQHHGKDSVIALLLQGAMKKQRNKDRQQAKELLRDLE